MDTDSQKIELLESIKDEAYRSVIIASLSDDEKKLKFLENIKNEVNRVIIVASLLSDDKKLGFLKTLEGDWNKGDIILTLSDDDKKIELLETLEGDSNRTRIIASLSDDSKKIGQINKVNGQCNIGDIIESLEDDSKKIALLGMIEDEGYKSVIIASLKDDKPLLCIKENNNFEWFNVKSGFVLAGMEGMKFVSDCITLKKGDIVFMYTDGVTEAQNSENELFSDARLLNTFNENNYADKSIKEILEDMERKIAEFENGAEQADDRTMIAFRI